MQHIIGMPPHIIIIGMPAAIIAAILSQHIFIMSMVMPPSIGIILQTMPASVISIVILHIGIIIGGIIIGMPIPPPIIGIIIFIGMGIIPIGIWPIGICIAGIMILAPSPSYSPSKASMYRVSVPFRIAATQRPDIDADCSNKAESHP